MKNPFMSLLLILIMSCEAVQADDKIKKESLESGGKKRTYCLLVPEGVGPSAPLLITFHGSGRNGLTLVDKWKKLAIEQRIIVAGPDSINPAHWTMPADGPEFIYDLVESLKSKYPINPKRVYLFGHSAGAVFSLFMSLAESEYFAASAVHAGALDPKRDSGFLAFAKRKTPIAIFAGTNDPLFPPADVRATRDFLNQSGFAVVLNEMKNHTHDYYSKADEINKNAWQFLMKHELPNEPHYERYRY